MNFISFCSVWGCRWWAYHFHRPFWDLRSEMLPRLISEHVLRSEIWDSAFHWFLFCLGVQVVGVSLPSSVLRSEIWDSAKAHLRTCSEIWDLRFCQGSSQNMFWDKPWQNLRSQISEHVLRWALAESQISDLRTGWGNMCNTRIVSLPYCGWDFGKPLGMAMWMSWMSWHWEISFMKNRTSVTTTRGR